MFSTEGNAKAILANFCAKFLFVLSLGSLFSFASVRWMMTEPLSHNLSAEAIHQDAVEKEFVALGKRLPNGVQR